MVNSDLIDIMRFVFIRKGDVINALTNCALSKKDTKPLANISETGVFS